MALVVNNPPTYAGNIRCMGSIPRLGRSLEEGMTTYSSILAWRISWTEEPGGLQSIGSQRHTHTHTHTRGMWCLKQSCNNVVWKKINNLQEVLAEISWCQTDAMMALWWGRGKGCHKFWGKTKAQNQNIFVTPIILKQRLWNVKDTHSTSTQVIPGSL